MGRIRDAWRAFRRGRIEIQASEVGPLNAANTRGLPKRQGIEAADFAREGYSLNVIAYRCIQEIAKACATVPLVVYRGGEEANATGVQFNVLKRPNPTQSWNRLIMEYVSYNRIAGNAYMEMVGTSTPSELYALRPDRMSINVGSNGFPRQYVYEVTGKRKVFDVDFVSRQSNILHWRTFNPLDDYLGMSPIQAAAMSIDQHNQANEWNTRLIANDARPPGVWKAPPEVKLQKQEREELEERINEKISGPANAGKALIQSGMEWTPTGLSPHDMDWLNSKHTSARDVCSAFAFPPMLLGIPGDNTYSNYKEARLALYEDTIIPLVEELVGELNNWLMPRIGDGYELQADWDQVSALAARRESRWTRIESASFLTPNEKRDELGWPPIAGGDELLVPAGMLPIGFKVEDLTEPQYRQELRAMGYSDDTVEELAKLAFSEAA